MRQAIARTILITCTAWLAFSQSPEPPPKFDAADVQVSAKATSALNGFMRTGPVRGGRYEVKNATMVDLIRIAYGFDADKVLGGPNWLEMNRFDVIAKVPPETMPETRKLMLQSLLEDRFKLKVRKETKPLLTYALVVGKKLQLKEADGKEEPGCRPQTASGPPSETQIRFMTENNGVMTTITLGPGGTIHYMCRNITMAAFAAGLHGMFGTNVGSNDVLDETGLKGNWNFDVKWSMGFIGLMGANQTEKITVFDAVEKQLGLKLEERQVPTPVIVVDSVNEKPSPNPPEVAEALPPVVLPTEFEVASIKPSNPGERGGRSQFQPGGRWNVENMPMRFLISRSFNSNNMEQFAGLPDWANSERFDIVAKAPSSGPTTPAMDMESAGPMIRALLADRFKMTYHTEDRPVSAYSLVAGKPKMKKADPSSRTFCKNGAAPPGSPPGSQLLTCQNITMAQFADRLQNMAQELNWPVLDATGIEGGWDFTLMYSRSFGMGGRGGELRLGEGPAPIASEPSGTFTLFEAVEKQLGLKLESHKRPMPVIVIDHLEQKPTEN